MFVAGILAIIFNPFAKPVLTPLKQRMVFTGAVSLLVAIGGDYFTRIYKKATLFKIMSKIL